VCICLQDSGSAEDGLYGEAYAEDGKVAMQSSVSAEIAKKHGWATCHRCFEGTCASFKFEWCVAGCCCCYALGLQPVRTSMVWQLFLLTRKQ
jgi:hypothetical protein